nr:unnamed protein product [Callosobruchus analis]
MRWYEGCESDDESLHGPYSTDDSIADPEYTQNEACSSSDSEYEHIRSKDQQRDFPAEYSYSEESDDLDELLDRGPGDENTWEEILLKRKMHTIGTLRSNRKGNPKEVTEAKLKSGQHIWRRKGNVYVSKWRDKRDVFAITTGYQPKLIDSANRYSQPKVKPIEISQG